MLFCSYVDNAGEAKSEGVEFELAAYLSDSLKFDLSASYGEAVLVGDSSIGKSGQNLPGSADFNLSTGLQYDFVLAGYDSFTRIDYAYIGKYYGNIDETGTAIGGHGYINLKAGMAIDQFSIDLFVNNLTNDNGITWVDNINAR